ncbi:MAG: DUF6491 family protein [Steroidobacteraceae bacterium]
MNKSHAFVIFSLAGVLSLAASAASAADVPAAPAAPAAPTAADAASPAPPREAQIPFANKGGIWNWRAIDNKTVLIESRARKWYKATLFGNCLNLPFTQNMVFVSNSNGTFDKFSSIRTRGQRCPLVSLVEIPAPPKNSNAKKAAPGAAPAPAAPTPSGAASP